MQIYTFYFYENRVYQIRNSEWDLEVLPDILVRHGSEFYLTDAIFTGYVRWTDGPSETLDFTMYTQSRTDIRSVLWNDSPNTSNRTECPMEFHKVSWTLQLICTFLLKMTTDDIGNYRKQ